LWPTGIVTFLGSVELLVRGVPVGTVLTRGEPFRLLGVMVSTSGHNSQQVQDLAGLSRAVVQLLSQKSTTDKIIGYLGSSVA
jgi:hypothetical protein